MSAVHAWIPFGRLHALLGDVPDNVVVTAWDADSDPPDGIDEVRFYVPPFGPTPGVGPAIARMSSLEVVQALSAGIDHIAPLVPDGVTLCNARGAHSPATSEWVVAAALAVVREFPALVADQSVGANERRMTDSLDGKRVTILGYGSIGEAVERRLSGWDVTVTRVARSARDGVRPVSELDAVLPETDVLAILVPFGDDTRGLISRERLALLPDGALVINAARGGIVDEDALLDELRGGRLLAALDVAVPDPLPAGHPLRSAPGMLYMPHVAGATRLALPAALGLVGRQLRRFAAGEPLENVA